MRSVVARIERDGRLRVNTTITEDIFYGPARRLLMWAGESMRRPLRIAILDNPAIAPEAK